MHTLKGSLPSGILMRLEQDAALLEAMQARKIETR